MEHSQDKQLTLAACLSDLQLWVAARDPLSVELQAQLLATPRLSLDHFHQQAPGADPIWLVGLWLARGIGDNLRCDLELAERLQRVQRILIELIAEDAAFSHVSEKRWFIAWDTFFFHLHSWYPGLGSAANKFLAQCDHTLQMLSGQDPAVCLQAIEDFNQQADRDLERAGRVAARIRDTELGQLKVQKAKRQVDETLNQWLAGSRLPDSVFTYIRHTMGPALQFYLINDRHQEWELWCDLLQSLCKMFEPNKSAEEQVQLHRQAPALGARLQSTKPPETCELQTYHHFMSDVLDGVDQLLAGALPDADIAPPMARENPAARLRSHRRDQEQHRLNCGDWLRFTNANEGDVRCQYLLQSPVSDELIFVNRLGHKVVQMSVGSFLEALDRRDAEPMANIKVFSTAMNKAVARLEYCHAEAKVKWQQQEKIKQQREAQLARERAERERAKAARQQANKAAREQALAEEKARLHRLKVEREQAELEARQALQAQREQAAAARIETLVTGMSADITDSDNHTERCTLAMIIPSTGKYIFFDQYQRKVNEWRREELMQQIMAGNIDFYDAEPGFDSRLEQIVFGQKRTQA
ncbi:DUF1631 domain-containing protein [Gilvimarinus agarilyticus]|uniref:DUF1631 family protein n=1 Tax=unclassified Gilvimarinus TaxID=2642066 RepID=UPI001C092438|nr:MULTISPECIES: DUF1631 family protein [unclassified Gilvimarinus]MBU2884347.1 DUF1631 domain-containing protein [Gilvimarinus agarilyticus]MDO6569483.1 DUF1631 family protein [Gilvimarinus sp. 2_MG-2023]MDO6748618.1 DUF1631 family protein [Gilvimarinus sp. 1_MG-2023]